MAAAIGVMVLTAVILCAVYDRWQKREPLLRVYPVVGRLLLFLRAARLNLGDDADSGFPFTSRQIDRIRVRALTGSVSTAFGAPVALEGITTTDVAIVPTAVAHPEMIMVKRVGCRGEGQSVPLLNFGAIGVGPASINAVRAIGNAARTVGCLQHTSELGLNSVNLDGGASLVWQIGPGYWSTRDADGRFDRGKFAAGVANSSVKLIELKLGQGARPGGEGFFPAAKNTKRIARVLGVPPHTDVGSPPQHSAFSGLNGMLEFVAELDNLGGKPVGIKICVGSERRVLELIDAMEHTGIVPSFITVDGGDGGTGSGAYELQQYAGLSAVRAVPLVDRALKECGRRGQTKLFASGGISSGYELFRYICLGADAGFFTRAPMVAMGCIQARRCHTGKCPTGITTERPWRRQAISPTAQGAQLARYYEAVMAGFFQLMRASGREHHELNHDCLVPPVGGAP